jgi:hypothetical protein
MRYFYQGSCQEDKSCSKLVLRDVKMVRGYKADLVFLTKDQRWHLTGLGNSGQPGLKIEVFQGD